MSLYNSVALPGHPDLSNIALLDCLPIPMIRRMSRLGMAVDIPYLQSLSSELAAEMIDLQHDISSYISPVSLDSFSTAANLIEEEQGNASVNPSSAEQILDLLSRLDINFGERPKTTKSGKVSTGKKSLELWKSQHPIIQKILDFRERKKLKSSFCDKIIAEAKHHPRGPDCPICSLNHVDSTNRAHAEFTTTRAETGRFSTKGVPLQQIPTRTKLGGRVRLAFVASPGTQLVSSDFSQIELRNLAHCAKAQSMIRVYEEDKDIHIYTACRAFELDYSVYAHLAELKELHQLNSEQAAQWSDFALNNRLPSKNLNFMIVYGASWKGLQAQLALSGIYWSEEQCKSFIDKWFSLYPEVDNYMKERQYRARRYGYVWDLFGRIRRVPEVRSFHSYIRAAGLRQAGNMPIQSVSAGQMKLVMAEIEDVLVELAAENVHAWPLLTMHDQLMTEVENDHAEDVRELMRTVFNAVMIDKDTGEDLWRVPVKCDGEIMDRWRKE